ncbi:CDGSH iron-sulfur domain-containing protein [Candidatus Bathyarchaeota archaeon]|nr:CDGSH iron-sulfur domain-containing protein [Candidatus Bathyarchaeota archaeon]
MSSEAGKTGERNPRIRVTVDGPYIVTGNVPLSKMVIETDEEGYPIRWREVEKYPQRKSYALCRCGKSKNKPYCDGVHLDT